MAGEFLGRFRELGLGLDGRPFLSDHGLLLGERGWTAGRRDLPRRADRRLTDVCWGPWTSPGSVHPLETHERLETHALASRAPRPSAATWPSGSIAVTATAIMALCCWDIFTSWGLTAVVVAALRPRGGPHDTDQYRLPDELFGGSDPDPIYAEGGDDRLGGHAGNDYLDAGPGQDKADSGPGADLIIGGTGDDRLAGGDGPDVVYAGAGDDVVLDEAGGDTLFGQADDDSLFGGPGPDLLYASLGADFVDGGSGADTIAPRPPRPRSSVPGARHDHGRWRGLRGQRRPRR